MIAFNRGPPGAFIKREKFGLINAAIPKRTTITPTTSRIVFVTPIIPPFNMFGYTLWFNKYNVPVLNLK